MRSQQKHTYTYMYCMYCRLQPVGYSCWLARPLLHTAPKQHPKTTPPLQPPVTNLNIAKPAHIIDGPYAWTLTYASPTRRTGTANVFHLRTPNGPTTFTRKPVAPHIFADRCLPAQTS